MVGLVGLKSTPMTQFALTNVIVHLSAQFSARG